MRLASGFGFPGLRPNAYATPFRILSDWRLHKQQCYPLQSLEPLFTPVSLRRSSLLVRGSRISLLRRLVFSVGCSLAKSSPSFSNLEGLVPQESQLLIKQVRSLMFCGYGRTPTMVIAHVCVF